MTAGANKDANQKSAEEVVHQALSDARAVATSANINFMLDGLKTLQKVGPKFNYAVKKQTPSELVVTTNVNGAKKIVVNNEGVGEDNSFESGPLAAERVLMDITHRAVKQGLMSKP